jgi:hypothetical protein
LDEERDLDAVVGVELDEQPRHVGLDGGEAAAAATEPAAARYLPCGIPVSFRCAPDL